MKSNRFRRNYSQSDLRRLISESQKKAEYINRLIDSDIHFHMMTESNSPLKERIKYRGKDYNINNNIEYFQQKTQRFKDNNNNYYNNIGIFRYYPNKNNRQFEDDFDDNNNDKYNFNYNFNNSLDINKPFHRERKHFPLINNKGNFFRNFNIHPIKRILLNNNYFSEFENDYQENEKNTFYNGYGDYINKENKYNNNYNHNNNFRKFNLRKNNSMVNMSNNFPKINIKQKLIDDNLYDEDNPQFEEQNSYSRNEKHYNPRRYDYEGSRYGDNTYNYYLNEPMRGDVSTDWKFPPLYVYNSKIDYGKSFPGYY